MTMTDTEAKALALVNEVFMERCLVPDTYTNRAGNPYHEALCRVIEREAATEARHAAELREQAERFSEVVTDWFGRYSAEVPPQFQPFILPAPDPLVEAIRSAMPKALVARDTYDAIVLDVAAAVRKIGEAGE